MSKFFFNAIHRGIAYGDGELQGPGEKGQFVKLAGSDLFQVVSDAADVPVGVIYNRIEKLRAIYSAGKQARIAAFPHLGRPNDEGGEGLKLLEEDMKRPLELMVQKGEIDSYELEVESTAEMRTLGEAQVTLSVNSMRAFEIILTKVYVD